MSKTVLKLLSIVLVLGSVAVIGLGPGFFISHADGDDTLKEIAGYKTWSRITNTPVLVFTGTISTIDLNSGDLGG